MRSLRRMPQEPAEPRYLISQKLNVNSIARTDGKSLPLLIVRSHMYPVNATPTVCGTGPRTFSRTSHAPMVARTRPRLRPAEDGDFQRWRERFSNATLWRHLLQSRARGEHCQVWR